MRGFHLLGDSFVRVLSTFPYRLTFPGEPVPPHAAAFVDCHRYVLIWRMTLVAWSLRRSQPQIAHDAGYNSSESGSFLRFEDASRSLAINVLRASAGAWCWFAVIAENNALATNSGVANGTPIVFRGGLGCGDRRARRLGPGTEILREFLQEPRRIRYALPVVAASLCDKAFPSNAGAGELGFYRVEIRSSNRYARARFEDGLQLVLGGCVLTALGMIIIRF
jgi:hypothetical protein